MTRATMKKAPAKEKPEAPWGQRPCIVIVDGPKTPQWLFEDDWATARRSAERMGYGPDRPAGWSRGYVSTEEYRSHPLYAASAQLWRWAA